VKLKLSPAWEADGREETLLSGTRLDKKADDDVDEVRGGSSGADEDDEDDALVCSLALVSGVASVLRLLLPARLLPSAAAACASLPRFMAAIRCGSVASFQVL
jgi:hypothetical protein